MSMIHKFLDQVQFKSHEDFMEHFHVNVPEHFNFAYDVIDAYSGSRFVLMGCRHRSILQFYQNLKRL